MTTDLNIDNAALDRLLVLVATAIRRVDQGNPDLDIVYQVKDWLRVNAPTYLTDY